MEAGRFGYDYDLAKSCEPNQIYFSDIPILMHMYVQLLSLVLIENIETCQNNEHNYRYQSEVMRCCIMMNIQVYF